MLVTAARCELIGRGENMVIRQADDFDRGRGRSVDRWYSLIAPREYGVLVSERGASCDIGAARERYPPIDESDDRGRVERRTRTSTWVVGLAQELGRSESEDGRATW